MKFLSLKIGNETITAPAGLPSGNVDKLEEALQVATQILFIGAVVFALLVILFGAVQWIASEGDKQKLEGARKRIIFAIVGLIVVFFAFFIVNFIGNVFDVPLLP